MTRVSVGGRDEGSALVEFVLLAVVLIVPFVYAVLCVFEVERAAYGVSVAAREGGRAFVTAPDGASAELRADDAVALALSDQGVPAAADAGTRIVCDADPCLSPGARVEVRVSAVVALPLVPHWGRRLPAAITVRAEHIEVVDTYRAARP